MTLELAHSRPKLGGGVGSSQAGCGTAIIQLIFSFCSSLAPGRTLFIKNAVELRSAHSHWAHLYGLLKPLKGNEPWPPFYGLHYDLASKCEKRFQDSLCAVESLNCTFKHSVIFVINIMVSEGREARTVLITNPSLQSGGISKASLILGQNTVFMKDFKDPLWAVFWVIISVW